MNEISQPSKWKLRRRRGLIALAWMVSLAALYYGIEDWRGRHAWNEYRRNYEAHVASLDFQTYIPKEVPDSENFAATPFAQTWFTQTNDSNFLDHDAWSQAEKMMPQNWREMKRHIQDLVAWQEAFAAASSDVKGPKSGFQSGNLDLASREQAAPAVLDDMKDDEAVFEELRAASARPEARYPIFYDKANPAGIFLPHLRRIKFTCLRLQIKACAELALGKNQQALDDVKLMFYLADTLKTEPFTISYLVRIVCVHITIATIWEGLAEHRWTDAQLQQLQACLEPYDFVADMQLPLHTERAVHLLYVDLLKQKGLGFLKKMGLSSLRDQPAFSLLNRIAPSGWYDLEKLNYCLAFDGKLQGSAEKKSAWHTVINHRIIAKIFLPALSKVKIQAFAVQTDTAQAAVACALERYRLANRQVPDNLDALVPRFAAHLPNDLITGEPFKYRRTDDGQFVLYSVGWNKTDDGGVPGKTKFDDTEGDWVW